MGAMAICGLKYSMGIIHILAWLFWNQMNYFNIIEPVITATYVFWSAIQQRIDLQSKPMSGVTNQEAF